MRSTALAAVLLAVLPLAPAAAAPPATTFFDDFSHFHASPTGAGGQWMTQFPYAGRAARALTATDLEYYSDSSVGADPFGAGPGGLVIEARPGPNPLHQPYVSGMITTYRSFAQLYGRFELRAQLPAGRGLWPAFWLLPASNRWPPEIDVMEVLGRDPATLYVSIHDTVDGHPAATTTPVVIPDASAAFHTYAVDWQPDTIAWFFDGREIARQPTPASLHVPMYLLINLAVGGTWPGNPDATTEFPARYRIAWVRVTAASSK